MPSPKVPLPSKEQTAFTDAPKLNADSSNPYNQKNQVTPSE
jgi:hypothetical protein